jgi:hypothetical protein
MFCPLPPDVGRLWLRLCHGLARVSCGIARYCPLLHDRIGRNLPLRHHDRLSRWHPSHHWAGLNRLARLITVGIALILLLRIRLSRGARGMCATGPWENRSTNSKYFDEPMIPHNRNLIANFQKFENPLVERRTPKQTKLATHTPFVPRGVPSSSGRATQLPGRFQTAAQLGRRVADSPSRCLQQFPIARKTENS